jgi:methylmalonyl-CoA mutase
LSKIDIQPFYNTEDQQKYLNNTGQNAKDLINYRSIKVKSGKKGNKLALKAVEEGMTGLLFVLKRENISLPKLLKNIDLNKIAVSFVLRSNEVEIVKEFLSIVKKQEIRPNNLKGYIDLETIQKYVTSGKIESDKFDKIEAIIEITKDYPNYKAISISGGIYLDSGANQVQEVAYTLNSLICFIQIFTKKGIEVQNIFDNLQFELGIGSEYFIEIGKFRAFNSLLHIIAKKYDVKDFSFKLTARTSKWNKSVTDANTNMLRTTTETMSAILGNVDGVLIDPYDKEFNKASDFSSRIAGNISTILKEESYFGKVSNPVDGSYYIEEVSRKIAQKALEIFKKIEEFGGYYLAFENGIIQHQIAEICLIKIKLISQRRLAMVGVNKYPNLMETIDAKILSKKFLKPGSRKSVLIPKRAAFEIEALRKTTEDLVNETGQRPIVELTSFGNLNMRKARAAFAYDFMGVSGFNILAEKSYDNVADAAKNSARSNSNVVVVCSSDNDYQENALQFVKTFREIEPDKILLLAGNPIDIADQLTKAGLDGFIHMKSNVINLISDVQNKIQKTLKTVKA